MTDSNSKQRMFDGKIVSASLLLSWQSRFWHSCEPDIKHATYPSLYEASWPADARMSISMRLSCKVSRKVCFAMFLHTGGKMDMELVWDERARNTEMPIQCDHQATSTKSDKWGSRWMAWDKETKALMELLLRRCKTNNIYLCCPPHLGSVIPCFVRALPFSASVLLLSDKH